MPGPYEATTADIMGYLSHYSIDHARPTVVSYQTTLKVFYGWAVQHRHIDRSPMDDVPRLRDHAGRPRPVPEADYQAALDAASTPHLRMAVRLAGELGLRRAEAAQVHADDIVSTDGGYLLKIVGKGSKPRVIPVTTALAEELVALADGGWVFPGRASGHVTPHWMGTVISSLLPEGYSMHKLRHRALTQVYRDTHDLVLTAALAGHSSVTTTQTYYVEPDYTELRAAMERMASRGGAS
jgi:integrase